jgi:hypothetical protein
LLVVVRALSNIDCPFLILIAHRCFLYFHDRANQLHDLDKDTGKSIGSVFSTSIAGPKLSPSDDPSELFGFVNGVLVRVNVATGARTTAGNIPRIQVIGLM